MPTNPSSELEYGDEVLPSLRDHENKLRRTRNLVGFWLLGLCNNYAYVVMLSAAFDILNKEVGPHNVTVDPHSPNNTRCNPTSTGAILLADILPALFIKLTAPFLSINTSIQVAAVVLLSCSSFLMTSFTIAKWMSFLGVVCAALGSGLGEITFLAYSSHFDTDVISTWSSGTGGAGVLGAFSYAAMASVLTPETTLLVMLFVPVLLAISFWGILAHPKIRARQPVDVAVPDEEPLLLSCSGSFEDGNTTLTFIQKLKLIKPLLRFMIPLGFVYFAEYFINQGLLELIVFRNTKLTHKEQYRWLQVMYQVGVLISRSSVNIIQIRKLWLLPILQFANMAFIFLEAYLLFLPSFWIVVVVVLYEGLLGGAAYVNTFYRISKDVAPQHREFSLRIASLADSTGIALAGAVALPVHDAMCRLSY
ncbi:battenin-like isoform X1 [Dermacentor silvarum]|uniref:battenin-like isoform X1 n=2 Tax=Dermacentor silvarum TaxID=543639 RepID=UPI0018982309|nr:battenin-like isoform X1 [Dermacentor silvarum]